MMINCTCIVQADQISAETQAALRSSLDDFTTRNFDAPATINWVEIHKGSGFTATKPSTSSIVSVAGPSSLEQSARVSLLDELCGLWSRETGCTLNEIVGVVNDPA
ncbi:hypothetical protein HFP51_09630 [Parasphingopyxis sp. CP4]|uniref:hypothetical protein n=1 Tax=Parasphingopyxis sp. CP4 TaxID=2724527 RepID=UPI0015A110F0|nr:hypothetical protein [Parasphingopyxis sp. CP4]QLC22414.1 hypothetical protein HFP51_09630 [Parasphingopyxis sp. CP4]